MCTFIRLQITLAILYTACYLQRELRQKLHMNIGDSTEDGLRVLEIGGKGRGVITATFQSKGEFFCTYSGELILKGEAQSREKDYPEQCGSFLFNFHHRNTYYW